MTALLVWAQSEDFWVSQDSGLESITDRSLRDSQEPRLLGIQTFHVKSTPLGTFVFRCSCQGLLSLILKVLATLMGLIFSEHRWTGERAGRPR